MKKVIGYGVSVLGLLLMALGFGDFGSKIPVVGGLGSGVVNSLGIILVVVGVVVSMMGGSGKKGKAKQEEDEVPIYKGKKIVGYRREK